MKLTVQRRQLLDVINALGSLVSATAARPAYANLRLAAMEGKLSVSASDLEVGAKITVGIEELKEDGVVLAPYDRLSAILRECPDESLVVNEENLAMTVTGKTSSFRVLCESPEDYEDIEPVSEDGLVEVDRDALAEATRRTAFAVADEEGPFSLRGIYIRIAGKDMEVVGTDGRRLSFVKKKVKNAGDGEMDGIVPRRALEMVAKLPTDGKGGVQLRLEERQLAVRTEAAMLRAQLIEGQFPDYDRVIPKENKLKVELPTAELLSAVRQAAVMSPEDAPSIRVTLSDKTLLLASESADVGSARVELACDYKGEECSLLFNPQYIVELLRVVDKEAVRLEAADSDHAVLIRAGHGFLYVLMPISESD